MKDKEMQNGANKWWKLNCCSCIAKNGKDKCSLCKFLHIMVLELIIVLDSATLVFSLEHHLTFSGKHSATQMFLTLIFMRLWYRSDDMFLSMWPSSKMA